MRLGNAVTAEGETFCIYALASEVNDNKTRKHKVAWLSLDQVVEACSPVQHKQKSRSKIIVQSKYSFAVLPDANTVVGITDFDLSSDTGYSLVVERRFGGLVTNFGSFEHLLTVVSHNQSLNALLVGDAKGSLFQFDLSPGRAFLKAQKRYGRTGVGVVTAVKQVGLRAIVGGNLGRCGVVDLGQKTLLRNLCSISVPWVWDFALCALDSQIKLLSVAGTSPEKLSQWACFYDLDEIVKCE